jgi:hypothetical protein
MSRSPSVVDVAAYDFSPIVCWSLIETYLRVCWRPNLQALARLYSQKLTPIDHQAHLQTRRTFCALSASSPCSGLAALVRGSACSHLIGRRRWHLSPGCDLRENCPAQLAQAPWVPRTMPLL